MNSKQKSDLIKIGLGLGLIGITILVFKGKDEGGKTFSQNLVVGNNTFNYIGKRQEASIAFQPIRQYIQIAYYLSVENTWVSIAPYLTSPDTMLETGSTLNIKVSQDCIWTYQLP